MRLSRNARSMTGRTAAGVRRKILRQTGRRRHQQLARFPITHEMHEAADRVRFRRVARNAGGIERRPPQGGLPPTHTANTGFAETRFLRCCSVTAMTDFAASSGEASAVGTFMTRTASFSLIVEQLLERERVSGARRRRPAISTGLARDQIGGNAASSLLHRVRRNLGKFAAKIRETIHCQDADAAAVGEYGQALAGKMSSSCPSVSAAANSSSRSKHAQQPGAAECGVIDRIRTGKRAGMGQRRLWRPGRAVRI